MRGYAEMCVRANLTWVGSQKSIVYTFSLNFTSPRDLFIDSQLVFIDFRMNFVDCYRCSKMFEDFHLLDHF